MNDVLIVDDEEHIVELVKHYLAQEGLATREAYDGPTALAALRFAALAIDPARRRVLVRGRALDLRPKEFDLLLALARAPGQVFTREQLLNKVWGYDFEGLSRTVDVHVQHVREKVEAAGGHPGVIATVWG